jgi:hypothetical protein
MDVQLAKPLNSDYPPKGVVFYNEIKAMLEMTFEYKEAKKQNTFNEEEEEDYALIQNVVYCCIRLHVGCLGSNSR